MHRDLSREEVEHAWLLWGSVVTSTACRRPLTCGIYQCDSSCGSAGASVNGPGSAMVAWRNSRFSLAMNRTLIDLGQTASHSYWLLQDPNPSRSIAATMALARFVRSGSP